MPELLAAGCMADIAGGPELLLDIDILCSSWIDSASLLDSADSTSGFIFLGKASNVPFVTSCLLSDSYGVVIFEYFVC